MATVLMADECMERALAFAIDSSSAAQHWLVPLPSQHQQDAVALQQQLGSAGDLAEELSRSVLLVAEVLFLHGVLGDDDVLRVLSAMPNPGDAYRNGGFGGVPATAAAVAGLEKRAYRCGEGQQGGLGTTDTGCVICLEEFVAGDQLGVMPCSRKHSFHRGCIAEWLCRSNACPLCRHALPS
ncbi:hypothetical protein QYE76_003022 [Lolium multiflorum]|uniref:RING-type domain-containing protein n=1 Tax=Lolium multiflorum TaxID=4521 RepID=A0AAD8RQT5_LOLMU|nr:RING-H2 finger protein ATL74-like [Lolium perenne]KAK1628707.1 hypothetical protein QYE76_003022 [Lolium multiflorum]